MLRALIEGTTDPNVHADLALGKLRLKLPALREALQGRFDTQHGIIVGRILAHIDYLDEAITDLSTAIEEQIAPFASAVELLCTTPGVQRRTAEVIIAETGGDMTAFPTAKHLASWAGICPDNDQSAGKRRSGTTRKGSKWLRANLIEAAKAASRAKDTYLAAQYQRLRARRGHAKAATAVAHSILVAAWHTLTTGEIYTDAGGDYFARRDPERTKDGSSPNSRNSDTQSPSNRQRQRRPTGSLPEPGFLFRSLDSPCRPDRTALNALAGGWWRVSGVTGQRAGGGV
jgi:transposase